ncbi:TPA: delta-lactam-biosynthetic de-N-acetylase [Clostridioides difficile]|uniref:delta-lactam-biosynthetic de-N-acetylase n=1 Tax=Clostridioides difficile TaxID=1496 RepID=UPI001034103F|nr:delta-lactam-biosynthetic de-N-acetylase [Clostridioides difficile]HBE9724415.1 delta-lactam-biosynthetic de-N-acetylase [Clostridioides difficile]HCQ5836121.1 delta-lactam-biosynthetic de-N-acetylase [Clostridioides difficile]
MKKDSLKKYIMIGAFALILFGIASINFKSLDKTKTQISSPTLDTHEYDWYFNPREDGKQPLPIKEADFFKKYGAYYVGNPNEKVIYLSFDAGYESGNTPKLLDTLKKHNAKAQFFVVESYIKSNPDLIKRMEKEGHLVCNHSKSHPSMAGITDFEKFKEEITSVEKAYKDVTGKEMPKYFRPPMGKFSEQSLKYTQDLGYKSIFWSFAYVDWYEKKQPTHEFAKNKIYSRTHPGAIVLLHPNSSTNTEILDEVLTHWEKEGYKLKTLDYLNNKK